MPNKSHIQNVTATTRPQAGVRAIALTPEMHFDMEADIVIAGFGGAGAAAAIEARRCGASVIVLEKLSEGGGNTAVSAGNFIVPSDPDAAFVYLSKTFELGQSEMDESAVRLFCQEAAKAKEFFASLDPDIELAVSGYANFPHLPHADTITKYCVKGEKTGGINLFRTLERHVKRLGAEVLFETPALELIRNGIEVAGIAAHHQSKTILIRAKKAIILTTGGYECDPISLDAFCQGTHLMSLGTPANTGDGLRMAQTVDAALWHTHAYSCPLGA